MFSLLSYTQSGTFISSVSSISGTHSVSVHGVLPHFFLQLHCVRAPSFIQPILKLGHLGSFQYFAITDNTAVNTLVGVHFLIAGGVSSR